MKMQTQQHSARSTRHRRNSFPRRSTRLAIVMPALFITTFSIATPIAVAEEPDYPYAVVVLETLGGSRSFANAINDHGVVAGSAWVPGDQENHVAIYYRDKPPIDIGTLGGNHAVPQDINNEGVIVGWSRTPDREPPEEHAFIYKDGRMSELLPGVILSRAFGVNDSGVVTGEAYFADIETIRAFRWEEGVLTDLGALCDQEGMRSEAYDINDSGVIVGDSWRCVGGSNLHGFLWKDGEMFDLPSAAHEGNNLTIALGLNNQGLIVGQMMSENWQKTYAALWTPDLKPHNLHRSGHPINMRESSAYSINDQVQVVGIAWGPYDKNGEREMRAFLWDREHKMRVLDRLFPPFFDYFADRSYDINHHGQIVAYGVHKVTGNYRGLVITPVDPEMSLNIPDGPIRADAINTWTVTGAQPGARITLVYGKEGGGHYVPSCNALKAMLQIADPVPFIRATADDEGKATFEVMVPPRAAAHKGFLFQAVDFQNCEESQLVLKKVE